MTVPDISVVMSVFNDAQTLGRTLTSVLSQAGCVFEFVVVNDGSTDESGRILEQWAADDSRLRIIHQENTGLTRALNRGCASAQGRYIARQDGGGDVSLPGRLTQQCSLLDGHPEITLTSCGTRFLGPGGETLYQVSQQGSELEQGIEGVGDGQILGPSHHGSVMFRRSAYEAAGGYRRELRVAQDLDLWVRLTEQGRLRATPEVLYEAVWSLGSISHLRRRQQVLATQAILECRERRRHGLSEQPVLERLDAALARAGRLQPPRGLSRARFHYFLGSVLEGREPLAARRYLRAAVAAWPWHLKAWLKLGRLVLRSGG